MTGPCNDCGIVDKLIARRCRRCYNRARYRDRRRACPVCGDGPATAPLCDRCQQRHRPRPNRPLRPCRDCQQTRPIVARDQCRACHRRDPVRVSIWLTGALDRLGPDAPIWFADLAQDITGRCSTPVTLSHLQRVFAVIVTGATTPAAIVHALRLPGRSPGGTARLVDAFFATSGLGQHLDEQQRRTHARRQRRLERFPAGLQPGARRWVDHLLASRNRALLHPTRLPRRARQPAPRRRDR
jgi:hypothetical protein